jgi:HlyD family secretion protein
MSSEQEPGHVGPDADIAKVLGVVQAAQRRRRVFRWGIAAALLVVAVVAVVYWLSGQESGTTRYRTDTIRRGDLTVMVTATGTLEPVTQVEVGSEVSGTIKSVSVDYNDRVKKGQVLAQLDTEQLKAKVTQSEASLQLAVAGVKEAEATLKESHGKLIRDRELLKSGMCSQEECDASEATYARAQAALERARAQVVEARAALAANRNSLNKATIRSPIDGIVLSRDVEPGQTVAASFQTPVLFTLAENLTQMELHVAIDEADVGQIKEGLKASFNVDAYPDRHFPAIITDVHFAPQTVEGVVTYETVLAVDNSDLTLRPGMTATAEITVQTLKDVLLVPNAALRYTPPSTPVKKSSSGLLGAIMPHRPHPPRTQKESGSLQRVWTLVDGEPVAVAVTAGATDGSMTQLIDSELAPGTEVITDTLSAGK